jgi:hypothetical protein
MPVLGPVKVLDVGKGNEGSFANPSLGFDLDGKDIHDTNPLEPMKYNYVLEIEVLLIFQEKWQGDWVYLKKNDLNPIKGE